MRASDTGGAASPKRATTEPVHSRLLRSLATKLVLLIGIFAAVPLILYAHFQAADQAKQALVLRSIRNQGSLIAVALQPVLARFTGSTVPELRNLLSDLATGQTRIRLLLRPIGLSGPKAFYFIAAAPPIGRTNLEAERTDLISTGIFDQLRNTCDGGGPVAIRYTNPNGQQEVLTSVTPLNLKTGCWVVVTSQPSIGFLGSSLGRPYWQTPELRIAAIVYLFMVLIVLSLFFSIWRNLSHFSRLARRIQAGSSDGDSFAARNRIPELTGVAQEFDQMVARLRGSAESIRTAAEANAHAFKGPIAVIAQSLEPLRRSLDHGDQRAHRACELIGRSLDKLDTLVNAARRVDEAIAETVSPPRFEIDLSRLSEQLTADAVPAAQSRNVVLRHEIQPKIRVRGGEEMLEMVVSNLLDNAISFSPPGGVVRISLRRAGRDARLVVEDEGPGVDPAHIDEIFDRYFSHRPGSSYDLGSAGDDLPGKQHFGIGLWLVRRNVEALGGRVVAKNRPERGFRVQIVLPTF